MDVVASNENMADSGFPGHRFLRVFRDRNYESRRHAVRRKTVRGRWERRAGRHNGPKSLWAASRKIDVAASIHLFGNNAFGWRLPSVVFGALTLVAVFLFIELLLQDYGLAFTGAVLASSIISYTSSLAPP
jgi:hypothetical protein